MKSIYIKSKPITEDLPPLWLEIKILPPDSFLIDWPGDHDSPNVLPYYLFSSLDGFFSKPLPNCSCEVKTLFNLGCQCGSDILA